MAPISHQSITNMAGIGQMLLHKKKSSLEQSSSLHNQIHDIDPKYLKKERVKNLKFPQERHRDESIKTHSSAIHLKRWARHFKHE